MSYNRLQTELASLLKNVPGVMSVGLGKRDDRVVLLVAINSKFFDGGVPASFKGVEIVTKDLGKPRLFGLGKLYET